jgi:hypothetical protein
VMGWRPIGRPSRSDARNPPEDSSVSVRYGSPRYVVDEGHSDLAWLWCSFGDAPECTHSDASGIGFLRWAMGLFMVLSSAL